MANSDARACSHAVMCAFTATGMTSCTDAFQQCAKQKLTPSGRLTAEESEARRLERQVAGHRQELARADAGCAAAAGEAARLKGEHVALQAAVVSELRVRPCALSMVCLGVWQPAGRACRRTGE
jgi:hypothetical protein